MSEVLGKIETVTPQLLLDFESRWTQQHTPAKDVAIRVDLAITPARYYQLLMRAADSLEGIATHPVTARRVRERRALSEAARGHRLGTLPHPHPPVIPPVTPASAA
ncbi:DUF3263 domain-containing protein [Microbacterium paraoxydans]|uniref:DUF3263 domain-containing protein n=1 Tax=Microbacterium paraoxydans TaxID=199592 RepID=A0A1H1LE92_9MICO|nr:DUF3263 domain-containing protein [Microbacterium paraoxydans]SDR71004.1 Protein of unknown function [Microbacterium paraoxydans]SDR72826.1 Protein of unknown function [Microbacterium paraoxydans]